MATELDSPSGRLETKIATTVARLTRVPPSMLTPITNDSGSPSSSAPTAIVVPLPPPAAASMRLGWRMPALVSSQSAPAKAIAPTNAPAAVAVSPPVCQASSISSNDTAEISTPAPKAMIVATSHSDRSASQPTAAPTSRAEPASRPHPAAARTSATVSAVRAVAGAGRARAASAGCGRPPRRGRPGR
jgi:hypothetical protein